MGYDGKGLYKRIQGILNSIVAKLRVNNEILGFKGGNEKDMNNKTTFVKEKDMVELACTSEGRATDEEGNPLPPQLACGGLQKGGDEESAKAQPASTHRRCGKPINCGKKKKTKRSTSNKTSFCL